MAFLLLKNKEVWREQKYRTGFQFQGQVKEGFLVFGFEVRNEIENGIIKEINMEREGVWVYTTELGWPREMQAPGPGPC